MYDLVIQDGVLVTGNGPVEADLAIDGEQIAAIGRRLTGQRTIDAAGCYVIPGGVDPHVHLQMPLAGMVSTDTFVSGTIAAACGGTTSIIDFASPAPGQSMVAALEARRAEADPTVAVDYGLHMEVPTWHAAAGDRLAEMPDVVAAGCATFKMYQAYPGVMLDDVSLLHALSAAADAGGRAVLHSEAGPILDVLRADALAEGHLEPIWHAYTRPAQLEACAVMRAAQLADLAGCPLHIFHVGCAESVDAIAAARRTGIDVLGETCPQYLLFTAEEHLGGPDGQLYICAPPLRDPDDQDVLWRTLSQGPLQLVSTDHCPWTRAEKDRPDFAQVPGGLPGIEARVSLIYHFGVRRGLLTLARWVEVCTTNAARWMGMTRKGRLAPGFDADIVIFDPEREKSITPASLHEAAGWTPYDGMEITGWPRTVLLRGRVIVENEAFVGHAGQGRFVVREF